MDFKVRNLLLVGNFFCDLLKIDYSLLNQSCEIVLNVIGILLWHPVGNLIVKSFKRCIVFLEEPGLTVSSKVLLNRSKVDLVAKVSKRDFFLDLLVLLNLLL